VRKALGICRARQAADTIDGAGLSCPHFRFSAAGNVRIRAIKFFQFHGFLNFISDSPQETVLR